MLLSATTGVLLAGCETVRPAPTDWLDIGQPITMTAENRGDDGAVDGFEPGDRAAGAEAPAVATRTIPQIATRSTRSSATQSPSLRGDAINVTLPPQPVPQFVNTVFGEILQQPFSLGPEVAQRSDIISLRSVRSMEPQTFLELVREALKDYGLAVTYENGLYSIIALDELRAQMPQFITSRAGPHVPSDLRPVVQFIELTAISVDDMQQILREAFPDENELQIRADRRANSMVLSGLSEDVDAALAIIREMDEVRFAGTQVLSFSPRNWDAEQLRAALSQILTVEGYVVGDARTPTALNLLVLEFTNQILIFAAEPEVARYAGELASRLDADAFQAEAEIPHVYEVRNADATLLAEIVNNVLSGDGTTGTGGASDGGDQPAGGDESGSGSPQPGVSSMGQLTVDGLGNRIIFMGTQQAFDQVEALLRRLDTRQPEVLIEVIIAEVTLTDNFSFGLDAVFDSEAAATFSAQLTSNDGLTGVVRTGQVTLTGTSLTAGNNRINVLSTPRIVTKSGSAASIQVGTDVPVITSQAASGSQVSGSTDILQTVSYRSTGVILDVQPRVYSGDRIDLVIRQELSAADVNETADIASPVISNRSITSELSLEDGQTAVLGGLIENRFTSDNDGIPFLKDVPVLGTPFRSDTLTSTRTMLLVLVTPYVIRSAEDRGAMVDALRASMNDAFRNQTEGSSTIMTPDEPMELRARSDVRG